MKKKFSTIALALVAALGINAMAQTPAAAACGKADKGRCAKEMKGPRACSDSLEAVVLFEGITLTPEQQTKIKGIKTERKQAREAARKERTEARDARRQAKRDYLGKMKEVLTPEQYVVFLENMVVNRPDAPRGGKTMMHRGHKEMKAHADRKDMRGERQAKAPRK